MDPASAFRPVHSHPHRRPRPSPPSTASALLSATVNLVATYSRANPAFRLPAAVPRRCLTIPSLPVHNNRCDNANNDLIIHVGDALGDYLVLDLLGTGTFGQVVSCRDLNARRDVAVKIIKRHAAFKNQAWIEISILRILHQSNPQAAQSQHIVRFYTHFLFRDHLCLVFELLAINLYQLLKEGSFAGINIRLLRKILTQLLEALIVLADCGIIHCDLKPENILISDASTTDVKLIDFGSACQLEHPVYSYVQSRFYRSPEVLLGLPQYDSQIDMWSLGCVAAELFLGIPLFPGQNEMNMVKRIVEMLGPMSDFFLCRCRNTPRFFNVMRTYRSGHHDVRSHQLKDDDQYEVENMCKLPASKRYFEHVKLEDIILRAPVKSDANDSGESQLRRSFVDLLRGMLKVDPSERLTPSEAIQHPFIQGTPLPKGWAPARRSKRIGRAKPALAINIQPPHVAEGGVFASSAPTLRVPYLGGSRNPEHTIFDNSPLAFPMNAAPSEATAWAMTTGSYIPPPAYPPFPMPPPTSNNSGANMAAHNTPPVYNYPLHQQQHRNKWAGGSASMGEERYGRSNIPIRTSNNLNNNNNSSSSSSAKRRPEGHSSSSESLSSPSKIPAGIRNSSTNPMAGFPFPFAPDDGDVRKVVPTTTSTTNANNNITTNEMSAMSDENRR